MCPVFPPKKYIPSILIFNFNEDPPPPKKKIPNFQFKLKVTIYKHLNDFIVMMQKLEQLNEKLSALLDEANLQMLIFN